MPKSRLSLLSYSYSPTLSLSDISDDKSFTNFWPDLGPIKQLQFQSALQNLRKIHQLTDQSNVIETLYNNNALFISFCFLKLTNLAEIATTRFLRKLKNCISFTSARFAGTNWRNWANRSARATGYRWKRGRKRKSRN